MNERRTVLVLGAGASQDYGFPLGGELYGTIRGETTEGNRLFKFLNDAGFKKTAINKFHQSLRHSRVMSIDSLLETRDDYREIGQLSIASVMLRYEDPNRMFPENFGLKDWYSLLFMKFFPDGERPEKFLEKKIKVVTFNYDRSFEYCFLNSLVHRFKFTHEEALVYLNHIEVIHVHGKLGEYWWNHKGRAFTKDCTDIDEIHEIGSKLQIYKDEIKDEVVKNKIYAHINKATHIHFIGFGFLNSNLKKLGLEDNPHAEIRASSKGITPAQREDFKKKLVEMRSKPGTPERAPKEFFFPFSAYGLMQNGALVY